MFDRRIIEGNTAASLFGGQYELIDTGFSNGDFNMAFDYERALLVEKGDSLPMFRLYGWDPWSVSLGANQKEDEIDPELCREHGFTIVRRPTGGRAVLHADELTYSIVMKLTDKLTIHDIYREIHKILLDSLLNAGCRDLDFVKSQPDFNEFYKTSDKSMSCFASSARYEISYKGRKLIGSAQRVIGSTLLQHGSILLDAGHEQIANVARVKSEENRNALLKYIVNHSSTATEAASKKITFQEARNEIVNILTK
jgi:lipoate-protein ligase A